MIPCLVSIGSYLGMVREPHGWALKVFLRIEVKFRIPKFLVVVKIGLDLLNLIV